MITFDIIRQKRIRNHQKSITIHIYSPIDKAVTTETKIDKRIISIKNKLDFKFITLIHIGIV